MVFAPETLGRTGQEPQSVYRAVRFDSAVMVLAVGGHWSGLP
jgi:hypothetical protein